MLAAVAVVAAAIAVALAYASGGFGAGSPPPGSTEQLTLKMSDGVRLACSVTYPQDVPDGTLPAGGHAGVILFPGFGQTHADLEPIAQFFAGDGYETLECDARGTGTSEGRFDLAGPQDVEDARELFTWLSGRLGNDDIGAFGLSLGGGEVWNAAVAGVPFKAIVPASAWTSLGSALAPAGVPKSGLVDQLVGEVPSGWDSSLAEARDDLLGGSVTDAVEAVDAARSARPKLRSLTVPTLILQGRHDFLFDLGQALSAYRLLHGPRWLYLGDLGDSPASNPATEQSTYLELAAELFDEYLKGMPGVSPGKNGSVLLGHDPWDGTTTSFAGLPPTRGESVNFPGTTTLTHGAVTRWARLTGGPLEAFGGGSVTVRYSGATAGSWPDLVATVSVQGSSAPVTVGAAPVTKPSGVLKIPLLSEAVLLPRGKRLVVQVGETSADGVYATPADGPRPPLTIGRVTLSLPLLPLAISR